MIMAMMAGKKNTLFQVTNIAIPRVTSGARIPPPMLWATFQIYIFVPRSLMENQWAIVLPHGGQPIP